MGPQQMAESNVQPIVSPDADQMRRHLELLIGGDLGSKRDGLIEIAWRDANTGKLSKAELFGTDKLEEATAKAVHVHQALLVATRVRSYRCRTARPC